MFDVLTCSHRRSARTSLADVVQDREGAPVRRVGLEEREREMVKHVMLHARRLQRR